MNDFFLIVRGIASDRVMHKIAMEMNYNKQEKLSKFVFFDYSDFDVPLNTKFSYLCELGNRKNVYSFCGKIVMATQGWGVYYTSIPLGHKSVCDVLFDQESYSLITSKIPIVDTWTRLNSTFLLSTTPAPVRV